MALHQSVVKVLGFGRQSWPHLGLTHPWTRIRARAAEECRQRGFLTEYSRPTAHDEFRYLMSTDGSTIDDTRVYWALQTGSAVFKQITPLLPYGIPGLRPWEHFVPVREDLADLPAKVRWAQRHDATVRAMAERGRAFAEEFFTQEQVLRYFHLALLRYAEVLEP